LNRRGRVSHRIVRGSNKALYRRLRIREHPTLEKLLEVLAASRQRSQAPSRLDILYAALVSALRRDRGKRAYLADERKAMVVRAVEAGQLSMQEACDRYSLTIEEFPGRSGSRSTALSPSRRVRSSGIACGFARPT